MTLEEVYDRYYRRAERKRRLGRPFRFTEERAVAITRAGSLRGQSDPLNWITPTLFGVPVEVIR